MDEKPLFIDTGPTDEQRAEQADERAYRMMVAAEVEAVGGEKNVAAAERYLETLPPPEREAFRGLLNDPNQSASAVAELHRMRAASMGVPAQLLTQGGVAKGYNSLAEYEWGKKNLASADHRAQMAVTPDAVLRQLTV